MAIFKCKMCGGDLPGVTEGNVVECEYCGSRQTIPTADNEKKVTLFARANRLRFGCEFDKAAGVYESIVAEFPTEAEAYWGLVLCKYGIEYVDDPKTGKKIPTCHRSSFDSVMEDDNFDQACENADVVARKVYRDEAKQIEELRKRIIEVSGKEEPYDIFICYKETDENGSRTLDSVLAQDIYNALTEKGYRVFFARISLEDKLGQEYEPYIFAALNSAKVMLAVGTDYEYYNAVWVKNEWSRYLALIAAGQKKTLIPCYKNIDAYDMPKEFARLQAQDMGKVGAMQDLLRGIEKIIGGKQEESKPQNAGVDVAQIVQQVMRQNVSTGGESNAAALLKRGYMALSDGDWEKANEFFDRVLDGDAENAEAYMGKFLEIEKENSLEKWMKVYREKVFRPDTLTLECTSEQKRHIADMAQQYAVQGYLHESEIRQLYSKKQTYASNVNKEKNNLDSMRRDCENKNFIRAMQFAQGDVKKQYDTAIETLEAQLRRRIEAAQEEEKKNILEARNRMAKAFAEADKQAVQMNEQAIQQRNQEIEKRNQKLESVYQDCCSQMNSAKSEQQYIESKQAFEALDGYKDSDEKAQICKRLAEKCVADQAAEEARSRRNKIIIVIAIVVIIAIVMAEKFMIIPNNQYEAAVEMLQNGQYDEAIAIFAELGEYEDAVTRGKEAQYQKGKKLFTDKNYDGAIAAYQAAGDYSDAATKVKEAQYQKGTSLLTAGDYDNATVAYQAAGDYSDAATKAKKAQYQKGTKLLEVDDYDGAIAAYQAAGNYGNAVVNAKEAQHRKGEAMLMSGDYDGATEYYYSIQQKNWAKDAQYRKGEKLLTDHNEEAAAQAFALAVGYQDALKRSYQIRYRNLYEGKIATGYWHTVGLKTDGTVAATGENLYGQCNVDDWTDIVSVAAEGRRTMGLKSDGTVVAVGNNQFGKCDVSEWTDIVAIALGEYHTIGLKSDGTVVATGMNGDGQCDVSEWTDIVAIAAGQGHTAGLKADGTVVETGDSSTGGNDWTDIVSISADDSRTIGLKADGTVVTTTKWDLYKKYEVSDWTDIVSIAVGGSHTIGLKSDGTVVATGMNDDGQCDVSGWTEIVAIAAGEYQTVGLKSDGTVVATGKNGYGQCNVSGWTNIGGSQTLQ